MHGRAKGGRGKDGARRVVEENDEGGAGLGL